MRLKVCTVFYETKVIVFIMFRNLFCVFFQDSNLHLRFANSVVTLEDEEKVRENEIKNSILALGSRAEMVINYFN